MFSVPSVDLRSLQVLVVFCLAIPTRCGGRLRLSFGCHLFVTLRVKPVLAHIFACKTTCPNVPVLALMNLNALKILI